MIAILTAITIKFMYPGLENYVNMSIIKLMFYYKMFPRVHQQLYVTSPIILISHLSGMKDFDSKKTVEITLLTMLFAK